jgi:hypothetical protein
MLSSKIKIAAEPDKPALPERHVWFYTKYSCFTLRALNRGSFQKFLVWMLSLEEIEETNVNSVDIEVFPVQGEKGHSVAGKCDTYRGRIRITLNPLSSAQPSEKHLEEISYLLMQGTGLERR